MSHPESAASSQPLNSQPHGSKRGACDRCRGQKLKCRREDQSQGSLQATCVRCSKASATCSYGIAKRAGRTPGSNAFPSQGRGGDAGGNSQKVEIASRPTVRASGESGFLSRNTDGWQDRRGTGDREGSLSLGMCPADQASDVENEDTTMVHPSNPLALDDVSNIFSGVDFDFPAFSPSSTMTASWPDRMLPPFSDNDIGKATSLDPCGSQYSWAFYPHQGQHMGIQTPTTSTTGNDG